MKYEMLQLHSRLGQMFTLAKVFFPVGLSFKLKHFAHLTSPAYVFIKTGMCPQAG
jgi:hypothetical protein